MKIILIGPAYPLRGGISNFNEALGLALIEAGHQVRNYSFSLLYPEFLFPGRSQYETGIKPERLEIIPSISSVNPFSWFRTIRQICNENPDLVIVHFWLPQLGLALGRIIRGIAGKCPGVKVVSLLHNVIPHEKRPGDRMLIRYFLGSCHGHIVMSKIVQENLLQFVKAPRVRLLPHPIYNAFGSKVAKEEARAFLKLDPHEPVMLFFGIVRPYKGLDLLLEALSKDEVKQLGLRTIVAGEFYEDRARYDNLVSLYQLENHLIITDQFIPSSEVKFYFSAADLVVQPYRSATQSGVTQVAYQFDRPMLVTNVGSLADMVPHEKVGYVVEPDADEIARCIVDFYENRREKEFEQHIREEKKKYSWEKMIEGISEFCRTL